MTEPNEMERLPTPDEAAGMAWWNNLTEVARCFWLERSTTGTVAEAYAAFKREQALPMTLRAAADHWRLTNQERSGGVVLIWQGAVYGWKNCLRDAAHEQPGAYAVDEAGHIFIAEGGNEYDGAKCWVAVAPSN
ncbi:hypothetical protein SAMN04244572_04919 [Azotobacter beijerinckii]|uniref:Antirestriction protein ArdR n=2 Tax=Azotobacter beijerinckii TaxID=170623 RepID=A0A1H7A6S4_9GAMM|nr:hypothetical protein SAMN04244579_04915 [Azotobacter beijerinckii]SEJ69115.1 hypothetical protein SAMN04244572_04919 [Azotobacter beijerinckii]